VTIRDDILGAADDLTNARKHVERVRIGWTKSRNPVFREHQTVQPSLLDQLHDAAVSPVTRQNDAGGHSVPTSRPPLAVEAYSAYEEISTAAVRWVRVVVRRPEVRDTPGGNIRMVVGYLGQLDLDTLEALLQDLKTWRRWALVMTGWETAMFRPRIACPVCDSFGTIRARATREDALAFCKECQHWWENGGVHDLADKVREAA
jgi:hypothetical protein